MTQQFLQVGQHMVENGRLVRYRPVSAIPSVERFTQVERLIDRLWDLSERLGMNLGRKPTIINTGAEIAPSGVLLSQLTQLAVEVHASYLMVGLADAWSTGIWAYTQARTGSETVNYRKIVDETYINDTDEEEG